MEGVFLRILNISIAAGWCVLAVAGVRLLLHKAPRWIHCVLWTIVGLRLILPFSPESIFSLLPSAGVVPDSIAVSGSSEIHSGFAIVDEAVNPILAKAAAPDVGTGENLLQIIISAASLIWILGVAVMLMYGFVSYIRIYKKVRPSLVYQDHIYYCDTIRSPFIFGVIKPRIFLPSDLDGEAMQYVIAHERAHLQRKDHL